MQGTNQLSLNLISLFISIAGVVITIVIAVLQKKRKLLSYSYKTTNVVENDVSKVKGLEFFYNKKKIGQFSVTNLDIQNAGNVIIEEKKDLHEDKTLKIIPKNKAFNILSAEITSQSCDTIGCSIKLNEDENEVELHFKSFEKNDKVSIGIFHVGNCDDEFLLDGKIKEGKIAFIDNEKYKFVRVKRSDFVEVVIYGVLLALSSRVMNYNFVLAVALIITFTCHFLYKVFYIINAVLDDVFDMAINRIINVFKHE